jgi:signal transduction histidine kinase
MRERAELIGADLHIRSRPGAGTTVRVSVPISAAENMDEEA